MRGVNGLFDRAVQGFHFLNEFGIESRLITYAHHGNLPQGLERIFDLGKQIPVKSIHINFPYASGRWAESFDKMFSDEDMARLRKLQSYMKSPPVLMEFPTPKAQCLSAKKAIIYINVFGEVTPCPMVPYVMGNIRNEPLTEIWKRHVETLQLDYRGNCPMGASEGREALRAHTASVLTGDPCIGGVSKDVDETE
jgi:MoaA/NifB/PqqE/SkfB family radical SAM enzyme